MDWTREQKEAIYRKNSNILVAAAAGSGKTAVLVERIINKIINEKVDIDKILVVTFTNAAASEMRERVLNAIYKKIDEIDNIEEQENLQRQILLINRASICTIDSFCLDVIRNNFFEIDLSPNFRIGDTSEMDLLKQEILEELFERKYEEKDEKFQDLIKTYTSYRDDTPLKDLVLKIFNYISSNPYPRNWLNKQIDKFNVDDENMDFSRTEWGKILLNEIKEEVEDDIEVLQNEVRKLSNDKELNDFENIIKQDISELQTLKANLNDWDKAYTISNNIEFKKWPRIKLESNIKEESKKVRDDVRKKFKAKKDKILVSNSREAMQDIKKMYKTLNELKLLIFEFEDEFKKKKKEKNVLDFSDVEHKALEVLVSENEDGSHSRSEIAKKYQEKFVEVAIDEYQDSNLIQEYILTSVSRGNNIFMVGDVKQSIYRFRQAMPELFLDKYKKYNLDEPNENGLKIQLFKNFRSRENILGFTNLIFEKIMSEDLGEIDYNEKEYLNLGAVWNETKHKNEIDIIDLKQESQQIDSVNEKNNYENGEDEKENEEESSEENLENTELEAMFVSKKIKELVDSKFQVYDLKLGKNRDIRYKDIVILLRSTKGKAPIFESALMENEIPVYTDATSVYLDSIEIQTILSLLKIIDNPMQDIPLVMVLRSFIGKFTDNDLVEIRLADKNSDFYTAILKARIGAKDELRNKIERFLDGIKIWREESEYLALDELIWKIYEDTGFYSYVGILPNGELRQANLKMLFERAKEYESASFKGLFNFIRFIEGLKVGSGDLSSAKIIGENEDVVRIMSIHKSKGLEFPVVFLSSASSNFNMQDLNKDILLNNDLGLGVKYIDYDMQIKYDTLTKLALKNKELEYLIAEEMRILYVALTRAKEKIYITGISKDYKKEKEKIEELCRIYKNKGNKINPILIKKYKSYLEWIEIVFSNSFDKMNELADINVIKKEKILNNIKKEEKEEFNVIEYLNEKSRNVIDEEVDLIKNKLDFQYEYTEEIEIPSKTSITAIAHKNKKEIIRTDFKEEDYLEDLKIDKIEEKEENLNTEKIEFPIPNFMKNSDEEIITAAKKGTIVHLCLKLLDVKKEYNIEDVNELINELVRKELITEKEAKSVNTYQILQFTNSNIWKELKMAKEIYKEQPFYINVPANEAGDFESKENILAQGIIDLFYINKDDELILVDYKTDFVKHGEENILIQRHTPQLMLYKQALENALNRRVDKIYIYSTVLGKEIKI